MPATVTGFGPRHQNSFKGSSPVCILMCCLAVCMIGSTNAGVDVGSTPQDSKPFVLTTWSYTVDNSSKAMWKIEDWTAGSEESTHPISAVHNLIFAVGDADPYINLLHSLRSPKGAILPVVWAWTSWKAFVGNEDQIRADFDHWVSWYDAASASNPGVMPKTPYGIFLADEPRGPEEFEALALASSLAKSKFPSAFTYANFLYSSISDDASVPSLLGKMDLDWVSSDEYYDVSIEQYRKTYETKLYPSLRPDQQVMILPFAAYCELGCPQNKAIDLEAADTRTLASAKAHYDWLQSDDRVHGMFVYRFKNLWWSGEGDISSNPAGTGLGLVDRKPDGSFATPDTLAFYASLKPNLPA